ncbi:hypothetical protein BH09BAC6_BH09BAC6_35890 [soil metagenome]|jgi:hypothetical protein
MKYAKFNTLAATDDSEMTGSSVKNAGGAPRELDLSGFLYEAIDATKFVDVKSWAACFDAIPVDPYIKEGYRYKSIGWFRVKHEKTAAVEGIDERIAAVNRLSGMSEIQSSQYLSTGKPAWHSAETGYSCWNLPQYAMQQSIKYNPVHGDMRREYPRINTGITSSADFRGLLGHYASFFGWADAVVLVQFQRVDCLTDRIGLPAVEGFHQDGNRHVGMLVVNRDNITADSGVSQYVLDDEGKKTEELIFNQVIPAGQLIYWNDKRVWHYGTGLKVKDANINGGRGVRDIILLSAKVPPANMPMGPVPDQFKEF